MTTSLSLGRSDSQRRPDDRDVSFATSTSSLSTNAMPQHGQATTMMVRKSPPSPSRPSTRLPPVPTSATSSLRLPMLPLAALAAAAELPAGMKVVSLHIWLGAFLNHPQINIRMAPRLDTDDGGNSFPRPWCRQRPQPRPLYRRGP